MCCALLPPLTSLDCAKQALLELLPMLELSVALTLLLAVYPMCQEHLDIKEHLILVLRKAMFRPDLGAS